MSRYGGLVWLWEGEPLENGNLKRATVIWHHYIGGHGDGSVSGLAEQRCKEHNAEVTMPQHTPGP